VVRDVAAILDALLDGVLILDEWGIVRRVNDEACRILESSPDALVDQPVEQIHGEDHALARLTRKALDTARAAIQADVQIERRLESDVAVDLSAAPVFDEQGNVDNVLVVLRDRTLRSAIEEDVAERQRLDWSGRIALGIAHEVKNPLGGIRGAGELIARRAQTEKTRTTAELIVREVDRIARLVDDFMVLARDEELHLADTNIHQVLDEALDVLAHDAMSQPSTVKRVYDPSIPNLPADPPRLLQVFLNLGRNALEAMAPEGGQLTVTTRMSLEQRITAPDGSPIPTLCVEFLDAGPGIADEVMDKVTTPFFTTRKEGTGLGLPLADHWVTRHGGRLRLKNAATGGTAARVYLPLRRIE
jgi:two-component system nitrogen regulation sensor histidine kinase GlnL